ncbi:MAG: carbohydrate binding family 9 domain-containing protein [Gemmatimonadales bacterium]|nr:carbohydrate binding family 9 domain-containing protein [Gemmatimonadales bacterium]
MLPLLALTALLSDSITYSGLANQLRVGAPRLEASITVDGELTEPVWSRAARLVGFSQYSPVDGRPAEEETEVLVWYSPTAIHFGVRAKAAPGTVRAHLAERDRGIIPDDYIEIQLGTFNDGRQAFVFGANPFGVQADGALTEGNARSTSAGGGADRSGGREQADLSPDYVWESRGRLTDDGYHLEFRIPFKSLRFQRADPQDWSLHIVRKSAASGREDSWAPARRAAASFLDQAGTLAGLTGIRRGLVLELNPIVTSSVTGARTAAGGWDYEGGAPEFGGNVRWGVTTDITVNGTVKPDFSQVEADAAPLIIDPRSAVFFQEKRPFFLDGIEYFATPNQLIYTRRVAAPVAAAKLTGRSRGWNLGFLSAVDDELAGTSGRNPIYNLVRVQRDLGRQSRIGMAYTDRVDGDDFNRVAQVDTRLVFGGVYSLTAGGAVSHTRSGTTTTTAPWWSLGFSRTGRQLGWQFTFRGIDPEFQARSGFINRGNLAQLGFRPSFTAYGPRGAFVERFTGTLNMDLLWSYDDLFAGRKSLERKFHPGTNWTFRGGWNVSLSVFLEKFAVDRALYADYAVAVPRAGGVDTIPFTSRPLPDLPNVDLSLNIDSPQIHGFELSGFVIYGQDENFFEWSSATIWIGRANLAFRPTDKLRSEGSLGFRSYRRKTDGQIVGDTWLPRLKVEYQVSRSLFLRVVGEYASNRTADLKDDGRTNAPILIRDPADGIFKRDLALAKRTNDARFDWLVSYQPTPGTVFFAGYGSVLSEDRPFAFDRLARRSDGFFTKLSYNFRL